MKNFKFIIFIFFALTVFVTSALDDSDNDDNDEQCLPNGSNCQTTEEDDGECCSGYCNTESDEDQGTCESDDSSNAAKRLEYASSAETITSEGKLIDDSKIASPAISTIARFPYHVSLERKRLNRFIFCNGVLVNQQAVLTVARCIGWKNPYNIVARVGISRLNETRTNDNTYEVESIFVHSNYSKANENDIAILKLKRPVKYNSKVKRACIDFKNNQSDYLTISGFVNYSLTRNVIFTKTQIDRHRKGKREDLKFAYFKEKRNNKACVDSYVCLGSFHADSKDDICLNDPRAFSTSYYGAVAIREGRDLKEEKSVVGLSSFMRRLIGSNGTCIFPTRFTRLSNHKKFIEDIIGDDYCSS